jgi:hypothetical protein
LGVGLVHLLTRFAMYLCSMCVIYNVVKCACTVRDRCFTVCFSFVSRSADSERTNSNLSELVACLICTYYVMYMHVGVYIEMYLCVLLR